ncbi:hypothetical protein BD779DRAFT_1523958 [Infundibulicybe gibba]|nr:hypothetical protein BD779DRAFT_1523958 [Infundibulicybe gibba]
MAGISWVILVRGIDAYCLPTLPDNVCCICDIEGSLGGLNLAVGTTSLLQLDYMQIVISHSNLCCGTTRMCLWAVLACSLAVSHAQTKV